MNAWKQKASKQALKSLFLAKYLLKNTPDNSFAEKLLSRLRDEEKNEEQVSETVNNIETTNNLE
jgi:hypothetical protein